MNACAHQFGDPLVRAVGFGLPVFIPDVTRLDWPDVVEARHHPGLVRLREELTELEAIAFVRNDEDVEAAIRREFDRRMRQLALRAETALGAAGRVAIGTAIGLVLVCRSWASPGSAARRWDRLVAR